MYHDRTAWRFAFLWAKSMDAAKDIDKEMLPIWACTVNDILLLLIFLVFGLLQLTVLLCLYRLIVSPMTWCISFEHLTCPASFRMLTGLVTHGTDLLGRGHTIFTSRELT
jgi:hypothetical protein